MTADLALRVEEATGPDRELDRLIQLAIRKPVPSDAWTGRDAIPPQKPRHFTASLDAAMTLVPEGWIALISNVGLPDECNTAKGSAIVGYGRADLEPIEVEAATPALALTAAALRARSKAGEQ